MLNMIGSELGVTLLNDTARHVRMEGVKLIPISDFSEDYVVESSLAWIPRAMNPVLRAFIDALDEEIAKQLTGCMPAGIFTYIGESPALNRSAR